MNNRRAVTMVELLMVIGLSAAVLTVAWFALLTTWESDQRAELEDNAMQAERAIIRFLEGDLRSARQVTVEPTRLSIIRNYDLTSTQTDSGSVSWWLDRHRVIRREGETEREFPLIPADVSDAVLEVTFERQGNTLLLYLNRRASRDGKPGIMERSFVLPPELVKDGWKGKEQ